MPNKHHIQEIMLKLEDLTMQLREDIQKINEPQAKALFDTSAEVLQGLYNAFDHYEKKDTLAWEDEDRTMKESVNKKAKTKEQVGPPKPSSPTHG